MYKNSNIGKSVAVLLLLTFLLSLTPQKSLHNLFANHTDKEKCLVHKNLPIDQIETAGINCSYDLTLNTIPYLIYDLSVQIFKPTYSKSKNNCLREFVYKSHFTDTDTRGSPFSL